MAAYSKFSDQELATFLRNGDQSAFAEIYNRFFGLLYIHAFRRLNDADEANDLLQEMFAAIWEKRNSFAITGNLSSYLYASVRNRVLNNIEHKKVTDKYMNSLADYAAHDHTYADHKVRERDLRQLIEQEINALPAQMRKIFIMSRKQYLSHKEIAAELDMSEQAVKSQVKRALKILRGKLGLFAYLLLLLKLF